MALCDIHPLPARNLLHTVEQHQVEIVDEDYHRWGPWLCQGYAWCVGSIIITPEEGDPLDFEMFFVQGYEDRSQTFIGPYPFFGQWISEMTTGVVTARTDFKFPIVGEGCFFILYNEFDVDITVNLMAYLRND